MKKKNIFDRKFIELTGCIHNHTEYSFDASIPMTQVIKAAKKNNLDYITINDHRNKKAKDDPAVLNEKELLVIVGVELNDPENNNHFLVFNSDEILIGKSASEYVKYYSEKTDAITFAAHPFERRSSKKFRKYIWTNTKNNDFDGIEIWNYLSIWLGKLKPELNGLPMILFPSLFVTKPYRKNISWWDELNNSGRRKSAIDSVDAHSEVFDKLGFKIKFLTHNKMFKTIRTNIWLPENLEITEKNVLQALKNGNSYIVNYKIGNPYNFYAGISANGKSAVFGEEIEYSEEMKFYFRLPEISNVKLFRNGKKIAQILDEKGFFPIEESGNYRLEITRFGRGWIYTNNIYVV